MGMLDSGFSLLATLGGPVLFAKGFGAMRVQQLIRNTPTARVRSMAIGIVELNGQLVPRSRVSAPFSGRSCVWWEVELQTRSSKSRSGTTSWNTVHHASSGHPFFLRDETGLALIYPQGADCKVPFDIAEETSGLGVPQMYMDFMESEHLTLRQFWAMGAMRFRERRLEEGQHVYVLGRANPRSVARSISFDDDALQATGTDSVGAAHVRTLDEESCAVVRRGPRDPAYIISTTSEKTMTLIYGLKAFGGVIGGPLVTLFGLWCLLQLANTGQLFR
jgi:hypothetical protein